MNFRMNKKEKGLFFETTMIMGGGYFTGTALASLLLEDPFDNIILRVGIGVFLVIAFPAFGVWLRRYLERRREKEENPSE